MMEKNAKIYVAEMDLKKALGAAEDDVKLKEKGDNEKARIRPVYVPHPCSGPAIFLFRH